MKLLTSRLAIAATTIALATGVGSAANAITFVGTYAVTGHTTTSSGGLRVGFEDAKGNVNFSLNKVGDYDYESLFEIYANESIGSDDDDNVNPISVLFTFTKPSTFGGAVGGDTTAIKLYGNTYRGKVTWNDPVYLSFTGGQLKVTLNDATFERGDDDGTKIKARFELMPAATSAVPEPATWAMMIIGFGAVGTMVRSSRRREALAVA